MHAHDYQKLKRS